MATRFLHQRPQPQRALSLVPPRLRVTETDDEETVHLVPGEDAAPGTSLCGRSVSGRPPRRLFQHSGCASCADLALADGHLFAEDKHGAMVNLRRWVLRNQPHDRRPGPGPVLEWMGGPAQRQAPMVFLGRGPAAGPTATRPTAPSGARVTSATGASPSGHKAVETQPGNRWE